MSIPSLVVNNIRQAEQKSVRPVQIGVVAGPSTVSRHLSRSPSPVASQRAGTLQSAPQTHMARGVSPLLSHRGGFTQSSTRTVSPCPSYHAGLMPGSTRSVSPSLSYAASSQRIGVTLGSSMSSSAVGSLRAPLRSDGQPRNVVTHLKGFRERLLELAAEQEKVRLNLFAVPAVPYRNLQASPSSSHPASGTITPNENFARPLDGLLNLKPLPTPASKYRADPLDPMDSALERTLRKLDGPTVATLWLRRLEPTKYDIGNRRITVGWQDFERSELWSCEVDVPNAQNRPLLDFLLEMACTSISMPAQQDVQSGAQIPIASFIEYDQDSYKLASMKLACNEAASSGMPASSGRSSLDSCDPLSSSRANQKQRTTREIIEAASLSVGGPKRRQAWL